MVWGKSAAQVFFWQEGEVRKEEKEEGRTSWLGVLEWNCVCVWSGWVDGGEGGGGKEGEESEKERLPELNCSISAAAAASAAAG